eukprot:7790931-Pyramimonas_sp.AAC.1
MCEMVDRRTGMEKNRLQVKETILRGSLPDLLSAGQQWARQSRHQVPRTTVLSSGWPDRGGIAQLFHARDSMEAHPEYIECRSVAPKP